jgi:hypothetical protein
VAASNRLSQGSELAAGVPEMSKLFIPRDWGLQDITRLVVLVPEVGLRPGWWKPVFERLSVSDDIEIALVALRHPDRKDQEERRRLNALLSPLREEYPGTYGQTVNQSDWASALQGFTHAHDVLVCFPEQQVADGFLNRQPLSQALMHSLGLPVIEVAGAYPSAGMRLWALAKRAMFQVFPFAVMALFFWLQIQINRQTHDLAYQIALGASALVEIGLIFVWSLFLD